MANKIKRIYLDYAAATPLDPRVKKVMLPFWGAEFGNPSALYEHGRTARKAIEAARKKVAEILHAHPDEIVFTSSGTESNALAILGVLGAHPGKHVITSTIEHASVLLNVREAEIRGARVSYVQADVEGFINAEHIAAALADDTVLVSVMYANNEIGTIEPIREIAKVVRRERERRHQAGIAMPIYIHTDACQAAGYLNLNVQELGMDLLTANASKIYGPKGAAFLYLKRGVELRPIWQGGGQESAQRSGTENVAGIVGLGAALEIADQLKEVESQRLTALRDYAADMLLLRLPDAVLNGPRGSLRLPNNINISIPGMSGEILAVYLDKEGIEASTGSACDTAGNNPSHVILGLGRPQEVADGSLRFSLGRETTREDINTLINALIKIIKLLQKIPTA